MRIRTLSLQQFRNYRDAVVDFGECSKGDATGAADVHLLVGPNAAGKTNILEALSVLSLGKSFHSADEAHVALWDEEFYRVSAQVSCDDGEEMTLEVTSQITPRKQKGCFVRDVRVPAAAMVGKLPAVFFLPQSLELFTGSPSVRRDLLDHLLCQVSPAYLSDLSQYRKVLRQRGSLLKKIRDGIASREDLLVWDGNVAELGTRMTLRRLELVEMLQCTLGEELKRLGENWEDAALVYERKTTARDEEALKSELLELLDQYQERDVLVGATTVGPHRDDWHLDVSGRSIATFASRGQQRTAVLALLFLEVSYLELSRGEKPLVLLDDVFSELDDAHQVAVLQSLEGHQVLISTTHVPVGMEEGNEGNVTVWTIGDGAVVREGTGN